MSGVNEKLLEALKLADAILAGANMMERKVKEAIAAAEQAQQAEPVAWGCFHFGGKRNGNLYSFSDTKEQADAYIANIHQSRDDITLRSSPLYAQPPAVAVPDGYAPMPVDPSSEMIYAGAEGDSQFFEHAEFVYRRMLAAAPQAVVTGWIDPNNKTQKQYLPHIGEPVLFCCDGVTYYGIHTGGSFKTGQGVTARNFSTWECRWMYPPAAAQKGGDA